MRAVLARWAALCFARPRPLRVDLTRDFPALAFSAVAGLRGFLLVLPAAAFELLPDELAACGEPPALWLPLAATTINTASVPVSHRRSRSG